MTPKQKAKELVYKFDDTMEFSTPQRFAKQCALIAVDEIFSTIYDYHYDSQSGAYEYWEKVKKEIEKL